MQFQSRSRKVYDQAADLTFCAAKRLISLSMTWRRSLKTPLPLREREGPAAQRRKGEGSRASARQKTQQQQ